MQIPLDLESLPVPVDNDTIVMIIEQFLMLILIIGRWMLPKGDLTRDQLSQLLLVYIGTAADIIEFFDSIKAEEVNTNQIFCLLVLSIWSWSLLQFTFVLTATKGRKTKMSAVRLKSTFKINSIMPNDLILRMTKSRKRWRRPRKSAATWTFGAF